MTGVSGKSELENRITQVAAPYCEEAGLELVHVETSVWNKETLVRIYLDRPDRGISLEDCVSASRQMGDLIDVQVPELSRYRLEISSPGSRRPLKKKQDFIRFTGSRIRLETRDLIQNRKKFTGILERVTDEALVMRVDNLQIEIPDLQIVKASLAGQ
jgi:ribosome maturation factor RimP